MTTRQKHSSDWLAFLLDDLEEGRRESLAEHLEECPECRKEVADLRRVLEEADSAKGEIQDVMTTIDWDAMPARITDYVYGKVAAPAPAGRGFLAGFREWLARAGMKPVLASLAMGLVLGSLGMYLALRKPGLVPGRNHRTIVSKEFLDRADLEVARRATLDYLEKSQYLLLDFVQTQPGAPASRTAFSPTLAKELLSKKKYLNPQLEKYQMAKAKAICDLIEALFQELAQVNESLPAAELKNIQDMIQEHQLLLKINIVKKELENEV